MATRLHLGRSNSLTTTTRLFGITWPMRNGQSWVGDADTETQIAANMVNDQRWFETQGGSVNLELSWISDFVAVPFTLSGTVTFAIRAREGATSVNIGLRGRLFRLPASALAEDFAQVAIGTRSGEISTSSTDYTWTATPTATAFGLNDRLLFQGFWVPQSGTTATGTGILNSGGSDNKYVELTEDVVFSTTPILPGIITLPRLRERATL